MFAQQPHLNGNNQAAPSGFAPPAFTNQAPAGVPSFSPFQGSILPPTGQANAAPAGNPYPSGPSLGGESPLKNLTLKQINEAAKALGIKLSSGNKDQRVSSFHSQLVSKNIDPASIVQQYGGKKSSPAATPQIPPGQPSNFAQSNALAPVPGFGFAQAPPNNANPANNLAQGVQQMNLNHAPVVPVPKTKLKRDFFSNTIAENSDNFLSQLYYQGAAITPLNQGYYNQEAAAWVYTGIMGRIADARDSSDENKVTPFDVQDPSTWKQENLPNMQGEAIKFIGETVHTPEMKVLRDMAQERYAEIFGVEADALIPSFQGFQILFGDQEITDCFEADQPRAPVNESDEFRSVRCFIPVYGSGDSGVIVAENSRSKFTELANKSGKNQYSITTASKEELGQQSSFRVYSPELGSAVFVDARNFVAWMPPSEAMVVWALVSFQPSRGIREEDVEHRKKLEDQLACTNSWCYHPINLSESDDAGTQSRNKWIVYKGEYDEEDAGTEQNSQEDVHQNQEGEEKYEEEEE